MFIIQCYLALQSMKRVGSFWDNLAQKEGPGLWKDVKDFFFTFD